MSPIWEEPITLDNLGDITDTELDIILNSDRVKNKLASNLADTTKSNLCSTKEAQETSSNLPSAVAKQESKAIRYFEKDHDIKHLKVVEHIQKLRTAGNINYTDIWNGKYSVTIPFEDKTVKMEFPPDTSLSDTSNTYTDWDDQEITIKETTRSKLWSKEWEKYLWEKENKWQWLLTQYEFQTLIQSLYPEGTQQEQILAFMIATGFYGWMWLKDTTSNSQLAVKCYRKSGTRHFNIMDVYNSGCSLVHSTFIG